MVKTQESDNESFFSMSKTPLVSVIVPNFNHAKFLERRLTTVYNQSFKDIEVILLDDHSTDNSCKILENYQSKNFTNTILHVNDKNSGSGYLQWEKGISLAQGEYIWIAESDDYCELSFLENVIPLLAENKKISLAFCQTICVNEHGKKLWQTNKTFETPESNGRSFALRRLLIKNHIVNGSMVVFRKSAYDKCQSRISFHKYKYVSDVLLWTLLSLTGCVNASPLHLNYFVRHSNATTINADDNAKVLAENLELLKSAVHFPEFNWLEKLRLKVRIIELQNKYVARRDFARETNFNCKSEYGLALTTFATLYNGVYSVVSNGKSLIVKILKQVRKNGRK